jgi:hypothetical protein
MKELDYALRRITGFAAIVLALTLMSGCQSAKEQPTGKTTPTSSFSTAMPPAFVVTSALPPTAAKVTPPVRIKASAAEKLTDSEGNVWLPDEGFSDGETYEVADAEIAGTKDPALFRSERYSVSAYNFALPNGKYTVRLLFSEIYSGITGPGERVFSFNVQGHEFKDFDIWVKAGGPDKAYIESVDVEVTKGRLDITFTPNVENPKICGIEILPRT